MIEKYALISLSDKNNLEILVKGLLVNGYKLLGTTSTAKAIVDLGYECQLLENITSFPEMLSGRVKTLQPEVHGGILADLDNSTHLEDLKKHNINPISLVVCNLYPFETVLEKETIRHREYTNNNTQSEETMASEQEMTNNIIENIDIGGVTLIRAAAKNYKHVAILCNVDDYQDFINRLESDDMNIAYRKELAMKAYIHTANYDNMIANYFMNTVCEDNKEIPQLLISAPLKQKLRYGENPHQLAYYFENTKKTSYSLNSSKVLQGKELSYNNLLDIDAAFQSIYPFDTTCAIALKHNTPCGVGFANDIYEAYLKCYQVDPISIFGGVVIFNEIIDEKLAIKLNELFLEIVIAPGFTIDALEVFKNKKNLRVIQGNFNKDEYSTTHVRSISGGYLMQIEAEHQVQVEIVTDEKIEMKKVEQLQRLFKVVKNVKSNAIVIGQGDLVLGISGGMVSRIDACEFAMQKALKHKAYDSTKPLLLASDGFFPFNDIVDFANEYNIKYIINPGGSLNDEKLVIACNESNVGMIFTKIRYFKH